MVVSPLVGRDRELSELGAALQSARGRHGRLLLLCGEPGIGKTRLTEAATELAEEQGMLALAGRPWESGGAPAYWPWVQLLRDLADSRADEELRAELGGAARWVAQLLPELCERLPELRPPSALESEKARFALFDGVLSFLRATAAKRPLLVVMDDLHSADHDSLLLFEFVARGIGRAPVLLLGAYQDVAARRRPEVASVLGALGREAPTIALRGFREEELGALVEHHAGAPGSPELVRALHETTEGNPFFTTEVVRLLAAEGQLGESPRVQRLPLPDTVRETMRRRFEPLDERALELLRAAAVLGREFLVPTVEEALGRADAGDPLVAGLDEAVSAGLVAPVRGAIGRYRFAHNLIRETLYADLTTAERARLHRAVGEALRQRYGEGPERLAELAHHFAKASPSGGDPRALEYAVKAGDEAMRVLAFEQAVELYELALGMGELLEPDRRRHAELLLALGRARTRVDHVEARATLIAAAETARPLEDPALFAEAAMSIRAFPFGTGVLDEQPSGLLREALDRLEDGDDALRARVLARLGVALYYWPGTEERRRELAEQAVATARRLGDRAVLAQVVSNAQLATWGPDTAERDLAWMDELAALVQRHGDELELSVRNRQIDLRLELGDVRGARAALRALELAAPEMADPRTPAYLAVQRGRFALVDGRYADAERLNAEAAAHGARLDEPLVAALTRAQLVVLRLAQGRGGEAEERIRRMVARDATPAWPAALALACCDAGKEDEARAELDRLALLRFADLPRYNGWLVTLGLLAEVCGRLGEAAHAEHLYELLLPFAGRNVTTPIATYADPVDRYLGILAGVGGDWEAAEAHLDDARELAERAGARGTLLRLRMDRAALLATQGDTASARDLLAEAASAARALGLELIEARVEERLRELAAPDAQPDRASAAAEPAPRSATLRREGDVWGIELGSHSVRVRDSKGVRCLALLLANPGVEVHSTELVRIDAGGGEPPAPVPAGALAELDGPGTDDAGPLLDAQAKAAYRSRLEELRDDIEEATAFNDPERAARAREEMEALASELSGAVGLGGRDRRAASSAERARVSVTKAIRSAIKRVSAHDTAIGAELATTVRTGAFCAYEPDPRRPLAWHVDPGRG